MEGVTAGAQVGQVTPVVEHAPFDPATQLVATTIGLVPFTDLCYRMQEMRVQDNIVMAREWFYTGNDPNHKDLPRDVYVKRDVWVTVLVGKPIFTEQGG